MTDYCDLCGEDSETCVCFQTKDQRKLGQILDQAQKIMTDSTKRPK